MYTVNVGGGGQTASIIEAFKVGPAGVFFLPLLFTHVCTHREGREGRDTSCVGVNDPSRKGPVFAISLSHLS